MKTDSRSTDWLTTPPTCVLVALTLALAASIGQYSGRSSTSASASAASSAARMWPWRSWPACAPTSTSAAGSKKYAGRLGCPLASSAPNAVPAALRQPAASNKRRRKNANTGKPTSHTIFRCPPVMWPQTAGLKPKSRPPQKAASRRPVRSYAKTNMAAALSAGASSMARLYATAGEIHSDKIAGSINAGSCVSANGTYWPAGWFRIPISAGLAALRSKASRTHQMNQTFSCASLPSWPTSAVDRRATAGRVSPIASNWYNPNAASTDRQPVRRCESRSSIFTYTAG